MKKGRSCFRQPSIAQGVGEKKQSGNAWRIVIDDIPFATQCATQGDSDDRLRT
jgi:hypothetical protein